jgi:hypothetical protein
LDNPISRNLFSFRILTFPQVDGTNFANSTPLDEDSESEEQETTIAEISWTTVNPLFNHPKSINSKKKNAGLSKSQEPNRGGKKHV